MQTVRTHTRSIKHDTYSHSFIDVKTSTGQTTVNKKSADSLYNPYKWHGPQTPLKMFLKNPPKFHDKAVQSNILRLNLNKISGISIFKSALTQGNPSFHFHAQGSQRRYPCTQTAAAVPKYFPCLFQFCTGYRIWHASRVWSEKRTKNVNLYTAENIQIQATLFAIFRRILINWLPTYLL